MLLLLLEVVVVSVLVGVRTDVMIVVLVLLGGVRVSVGSVFVQTSSTKNVESGSQRGPKSDVTS